MKIHAVKTHLLEIPFHDGGKGEGIGPTTWKQLDLLLVEVHDEQGNVGWGEGFGYFVTRSTRGIVDRLIAPTLVGETVDDVPAWNRMAQRRLHLFGRYGVTLFAISAVDIALWDLAAKRAGVPLSHLLARGEVRPSAPFYASLVRYADPALVARIARDALHDGFTSLKLHEIAIPELDAVRSAVGPDVPISVDVNANWSFEETEAFLPTLERLPTWWLEEPIFPPEDGARLARLRGRGVPIAAGENWSTSVQFEEMVRLGAVDVLQPSVTKVGGISQFLAIANLAEAHGLPLLPHSPYFGPGFFASLHLAAALDQVRELEWLYVQPEAWIAPIARSQRQPWHVDVPTTPGIGFEPDPVVMERYRVE